MPPPSERRSAFQAARSMPESYLFESTLGRQSIQGISSIPEHIRNLFVTAFDVSPEWHVRVQAAFQKYVDNAVSKTINLPTTATQDDVRETYTLAYRLGCKGITVFRTGTRGRQVLDLNIWCPSCIIAREEAAKVAIPPPVTARPF